MQFRPEAIKAPSVWMLASFVRYEPHLFYASLNCFKMKRIVTLDLPDDKKDGSPFKPKKKHPSFCQNLIDYVTEWTENSSLHGVRYLGEHKRNIFEKLWWVIVFIISLYVCIGLIIRTYQKWDSSPVIVSFAQSPTPVWRIPFPAVTVCPETKTRQTKFNFTRFYHMHELEKENMTEKELKMLNDIALVCDSHLINDGNETTDYEAIEILSQVAPSFDEVFFQCKWTNYNETCDQLFSKVLTEEGVCFTFNMLDRDDIYTNEVYHNQNYMSHGRDRNGWTLENGYVKEAGKDTFPRRAMSAGSKAGLTMLMRAFQYDLDFVCKGPVQGFKILLHHPGETPRVSTQYFRGPLNQEVVVAVKPDMMTTSAGLRDYDAHRRKCYFSSERSLRFYKNYTQQNCEVECLANYTLRRCGCVAYHMPHGESTEICGSGNIQCMLTAQSELLTISVSKGLLENEGEDLQEDWDCDCLPACTSLAYNAETSQADFNWTALFKAFNADVNEFPGAMYTRITIFFKEQQFITSERNELYGITDFLASCGGLLGLFIGFSFLSVVETIYFITLRLWCNVRRHGKFFWSGSENLLSNDAYEHKK